MPSDEQLGLPGRPGLDPIVIERPTAFQLASLAALPNRSLMIYRDVWGDADVAISTSWRPWGA